MPSIASRGRLRRLMVTLACTWKGACCSKRGRTRTTSKRRGVSSDQIATNLTSSSGLTLTTPNKQRDAMRAAGRLSIRLRVWHWQLEKTRHRAVSGNGPVAMSRLPKARRFSVSWMDRAVH